MTPESSALASHREHVAGMLLFSLGKLCVFVCCQPGPRRCPAEADQKEKADTCRKLIRTTSDDGHEPDLIGDSFASEPL